MVVVQAVINTSALFAEFNQPGRPEQFKLLADCSLVHTKGVGYRLNRHFPFLEDKENSQPGSITEYFKEIGHLSDFLFSAHTGLFSHVVLRGILSNPTRLYHPTEKRNNRYRRPAQYDANPLYSGYFETPSLDRNQDNMLLPMHIDSLAGKGKPKPAMKQPTRMEIDLWR